MTSGPDAGGGAPDKGRDARDAARASTRADPARLLPPAAEWAVLAGLVALFVWRALVPAWLTLNTDFPNTYLGARLLHDGWPLDRIYDWLWFQRQKDHAGLDQGLVGCIEATPFSVLLTLPLIGLPALAAKRVWIVFNLALLGGVIALLHRMTRQGARRIALIVFLCVIPLRTNFTFGQQHLVILFLLTVAAWLYFDGRPLGAGVALAIAAALKLYPALFLLYFVRKRQWRAAAGLAGALCGLGVVAFGVFGADTLRTYFVEILPRVLRGEGNEPTLVGLNSPTVLLRRLFVGEPQLNPGPLLHAPLAFILLQPIVQNALLVGTIALVPSRRARGRGGGAGAGDLAGEKIDWAAFVTLLLILSPGSSTYHFCAIILAAVLAFDHLSGAGRTATARAAMAFYALVSLPLYRFAPDAPAGWRIFLGFPRLYVLAAFFLCLLGALWRERSGAEEAAGTTRAARAAATTRAGPSSAFESRFLAVAFVALALAGVGSQLRHFRGLLTNYAARVPVAPGSAAAGSLITGTPATAGTQIYFTRMDDEGYLVDRTGGALQSRADARMDLLYPAVTAGLSFGWIEASARTSRILRFPRDAPAWSAAALPIDVADGEQPAISPDGRWLGFLREDHGRAGLWVQDRRATDDADTTDATPAADHPGRERALVAATDDVLDFGFFPDGRIVFSARPDGQPALFTIDPAAPTTDASTPAPTPLAGPDGPARYPAIAPDGRWLVYSQRAHAAWQLWVASLASGERRQLTDADCNAVSPTWLSDGKTIVYATDCGRAVGQTALATMRVVP